MAFQHWVKTSIANVLPEHLGTLPFESLQRPRWSDVVVVFSCREGLQCVNTTALWFVMCVMQEVFFVCHLFKQMNCGVTAYVFLDVCPSPLSSPSPSPSDVPTLPSLPSPSPPALARPPDLHISVWMTVTSAGLG